MRSATLPSRWRERRSTVRSRKRDPLAEQLAQALLRRPAVGADHRQVDRRRALEAGVREQRGRRARPAATVRDFGSKTSRTGASLLDSSRTASSTREQRRLQLQLLGAERLLAGACSFGLVSSSISSSTFCALAPGGSSVTTSCHWPRARSSIFQRARTLSEPRPVA